MIRDHIVVQILKHKVIIAGDPLVGKMDNRTVPACRSIGFGKRIGAGSHHRPHSRRGNIGEFFANIVAVIESDRDILLKHRVVGFAVHLCGCAWLNGYDGSHMIGIQRDFPAGEPSLGMGH